MLHVGLNTFTLEIDIVTVLKHCSHYSNLSEYVKY